MSNLHVPSGNWPGSQMRETGLAPPPPDDNEPQIGAIIAEEDRLIADARKAGVEIQKTTQKTFEAWITLARGVRAARNRADRIKGKTVFEHILAQERLDKVLGNTPASIKSTASRLLKILEHEAEVMLWRAGLSDYERMQWSSPQSVCSRCPALKFKGEPGEEKAQTEKMPTPTERIRALEADNAHLREELARYDTSEPAQNPGKRGKAPPKANGAKGFLEAWKPLREALKDVPPKERLKALTKVQNDILAEIKGLTEETTETPAPKQNRTRRKKADIEAEEEAERAKALEDLRTSEQESTEEEQLAKSLDLAASVEAAQKAGTWPPPTPAEAAQAAPASELTSMERKARIRKADPYDPEMWAKVANGEMTLEEAERELGLA